MDEHSTRRIDPHRRKKHTQTYRFDDDPPRDDDRQPSRLRDTRIDDADDTRRLGKRSRVPIKEPRSGRKRRWLAPLAALGLVIWFSPMLVSKTPLANWAIHTATADVKGTVRCHAMSLGWLSPITLEGLELDDAQGQPLAKIARATTDKRLWSWLLNHHDLGAIRVEDPQLTIVFEKEETNFERVLAAWIKSDPKDKEKSLIQKLVDAGITSFELDVVGGMAALIDQPAGRRATLDSLQASLRMASPADGIKGRLQGNAEQDQHIAPFEATVELVPPAQNTLTGQNQLTVKSEAFPLWILAAGGRRLSPGLELEGQLTSNLECTWQQHGAQFDQASVKADIAAKNLYCAAAWLKGDRLRLAEAHLPIEITLRGDQLTVTQARLESELGQMAFTGTIDTAAGWLKSLQSKPYQLNGHVDLARLAAMLPNTIRVRNDTQITAGEIDLVLNADAKHDGLQWQGRLDASKLLATSGTQTLSWDKPVHLEFSAHETPQGLAVDRVYGEADFLELQGEGTPGQGHLSASFDFDKLAGQLARFIDLSTLRMTGTGTAYITWQREANEQFQASAQIDAKNFEMSRVGGRTWREPQIELATDLIGTMNGPRLSRIDSAEMRVTADADVLTARLHQPVLEFDKGGLWSVAVKLRGELGRWLPRIEPWLGLYAEYELAGDCDLTADVVYSPSSFELEPLTGRISNLRLSGPHVNITEALVDVTGTAVWNREAGRFSMTDGRWASSALTAEAQDVLVVLDKNQTAQWRGKLTYTADLARMWQWTSSPQTPSPWQLSGRLTGNAELHTAADVLHATFDNSVDNFFAIHQGSQTWQEPQIRLNVQVQHDAKQKLLKLDQFSVAAQALACAAIGEISELDTNRTLRLDGNLRYDLGRLAPLWQQYTGPGVHFVGAGERSFSLRGPLADLAGGTKTTQGLVAVHRGQPADARGLMALEGNGGLHWDGGDLFGFTLGPGDLQAKLARGVLNCDPIDSIASQGRIHLVPTVRLSPAPAQLTVAAGRIADQVQLTPEMCQRALKFIAPVLADVTEASGNFTVDLEGCQIPLANAAQADIAGKMTIHTVTIGAGPLIRTLSVLMNHGASAEMAHDSVVEFRMVDGRIYHRGLQLVFPEFKLDTYGSVGLDESLAIMAEFPVPPKWLSNDVMNDTLRGQRVQLPINGTLRSPKIDEKVLAETSAKFLGRAATGAIKSGLINSLEHIFGPRQQ